MKLGVPRLGIYSNEVKKFLQDFGLEVIMPSKVTPDIIHDGVMNSSDMMCYPYKVTLGQQIWCLEHGATDVIMFDAGRLCRFKCYHHLQEITLRNLGYHFNMHSFNMRGILIQLMRLTKAPLWKLIPRIVSTLPGIIEVENANYPPSNSALRVGLIGEFYTMVEPDINYDIIRKLYQMDVNVHISITLSEYVKNKLSRNRFADLAEKKEAKQLMPNDIGGHAFSSLYNTIWYGRHHFDGVIHLLPLSCMPESTVEVLVDQAARRYKIPVYRFPIDENNFEAGFNTRLSTFISMLRRKKKIEALSGD